MIGFSLSSVSPDSPWCHYWLTELCKIRDFGLGLGHLCVSPLLKGLCFAILLRLAVTGMLLWYLSTLLFDALWVWHLLILCPGALMSSGVIEDVVWFIFPIVFVLQWFPGEGAVSAFLRHFKTRSGLQFFEILIFWLLLTPFNPCWI